MEGRVIAMEPTKYLQALGDTLLTQAGIVAFTFFWWNIYLIYDNRGLRKEIKGLNKAMYDMGIQQIAAMVENTNTLDKIGDVVSALTPERRP